MENTISPLHAELASLIWVMETVKHLGYLSIRFETDCLLLTKLIEEEENWPTLASEIDNF